MHNECASGVYWWRKKPEMSVFKYFALIQSSMAAVKPKAPDGNKRSHFVNHRFDGRQSTMHLMPKHHISFLPDQVSNGNGLLFIKLTTSTTCTFQWEASSIKKKLSFCDSICKLVRLEGVVDCLNIKQNLFKQCSNKIIQVPFWVDFKLLFSAARCVQCWTVMSFFLQSALLTLLIRLKEGPLSFSLTDSPRCKTLSFRTHLSECSVLFCCQNLHWGRYLFI